MRYVGNTVGTWLVNRAFASRYTDVFNGFKAVRADLARAMRLEEPRFTVEAEMVIKCLGMGRTLVEVPVHELRRRYSTSRLNMAVQVFDCVRCLMKHRAFCRTRRK